MTTNEQTRQGKTGPDAPDACVMTESNKASLIITLVAHGLGELAWSVFPLIYWSCAREDYTDERRSFHF